MMSTISKKKASMQSNIFLLIKNLVVTLLQNESKLRADR